MIEKILKLFKLLLSHISILYSIGSVILPILIIKNAHDQHSGKLQQNYMIYLSIYLTQNKLNLLLFFNAIIVIIFWYSNIMIWIFFGEIRIIEQKYVLEKSQKKIFQFLLLSIVLRNTFDIYKMLGLSFLFSFCIVHWLVNKRSDFLVSRGSRDYQEHLKIMILSNILIVISFIISYSFYQQFSVEDNWKLEFIDLTSEEQR